MKRKEALKILGFPENSNPTHKEIKYNRNTLAKKGHPDKRGKTDLMQNINEAFATLSAQTSQNTEETVDSDLASLFKRVNTNQIAPILEALYSENNISSLDSRLEALQKVYNQTDANEIYITHQALPTKEDGIEWTYIYILTIHDMMQRATSSTYAELMSLFIQPMLPNQNIYQSFITINDFIRTKEDNNELSKTKLRLDVLCYMINQQVNLNKIQNCNTSHDDLIEIMLKDPLLNTAELITKYKLIIFSNPNTLTYQNRCDFLITLYADLYTTNTDYARKQLGIRVTQNGSYEPKTLSALERSSLKHPVISTLTALSILGISALYYPKTTITFCATSFYYTALKKGGWVDIDLSWDKNLANTIMTHWNRDKTPKDYYNRDTLSPLEELSNFLKSYHINPTILATSCIALTSICITYALIISNMEKLEAAAQSAKDLGNILYQ